METCNPTPEHTKLLLNSLIHAAILFSILTGFYSTYGAKIESQESNQQFKQIMTKNVKKILQKGEKESHGQLKKGIKEIEPVLNILKRFYDQPDTTIKEHNKWVFRSAGIVSLFLFVCIMIALLTLKYSCGQCPTSFMWEIGVETLLVFGGIGVVEYLFFKNVALKLIPSPPSFMVDQIISKIKKDIV